MRIDLFTAENPIKLTGLSQLFDNLNVGDVIKAKVLEIATGEALLKIFDGTAVRASIPDDLAVEKGQTLELSVTEKSGGKLFLETVKTPVETGVTVLKESQKIAGIPEKIIVDTTAELAANGLKASKEAIRNIQSLLKSYPGIDIPKAVFMIKNNLNISEKNIASLNRLIDIKSGIGTRLEKLAESIMQTGDLPALEKLADSIRDLNDVHIESAGTNVKIKAQQQDQIKQIVSGDIPQEELIPVLLKDQQISGLIQKLKTLVEMQRNNPVPENDEHKEDYEYIISSVKKMLPEGIKEKAPEIIKEAVILLSKDLETINADLKNGSLRTNGGLKTTDILKINNGLNITDDVKTDIGLKFNDDLKLNDEHIVRTILKLADRAEAAVNKIKKEFESISVKLEKHETALDVEVKKIFKEIYARLESVKNSIDITQSSGREIFVKADNMQDDIRFMNDIYKYSTYIQLPLSISQRQMTGELYILKNKHGKTRPGKESSTVFISLDTPRLGRFESLVEIKGRNIILNVRFESEESIEYFKENFKQLYNSLQSKGYRISDVRYKLIEKPINLINASKELMPSGDGKSIDLRI